MKDSLKLAAVVVLAGVFAYLSTQVLAAVLDVPVTPVVESSDTDDLLSGRYHQRTRVNKFFRRGSASSNTDALVAGRYHQRTRVNKFFGRGRA
jgi:hypothetical protein